MPSLTLTKQRKYAKSYFVIYPFSTPRKRFLAWEKARGMWSRRIPDPIDVAKKIRKELDRELPSIS